ncbi:putative ethylmalonyl-CoA decarboxylase [Apostichopus japonicus]|uniref:Ethylmalonyl-CoA decarboxylase n=1 Tax=Stichopus japonicus TaxID=307972 RepID=A0A2G8KY33_STIJA|nr:putative ethylmalonyl-CoA decarboxylase [Apostichopus japonicus]
MLQAISRRAVLPARLGLKAMSSRADNNEYFYQTDFSHASVVLGETTASMAVDQKHQSMNANYAPHNYVNNRMERTSLKDASGGKVELHRNFETGVAEITLSNPEKANALSGLRVLGGGKAVILFGDPEGSNFCAGADLHTIRQLGTKQGGMMCLFMQNVLSRLQRLPLISVAAVSGRATGGGAELTTACDFRVMSPDASIQFVQAKMGMSPGFGGGSRLVRIVGPRTALKLLTSTQMISSEEALNFGLSDSTVSETKDICQAASDWLGQYTAAPVDVVRAMKTVVKHATELTLDQALLREKHVFTSLWGGPEQRKAFAKVSQK